MFRNFMQICLLFIFAIFSCNFRRVAGNLDENREDDFKRPSSSSESENNDDDHPPFRLKRYNKAWEKAQLYLKDHSDQQEKLFAELSKLDRRALVAKHDYASGTGNKDATTENALKDLDRKLLQLLKNYQLYDVAESIRAYLEDDRLLEEVFGHDDPNHDQKKSINKSGPGIIMDDERQLFLTKNQQNLHKLWQEAKTAGFSEEELIELRQEFMHYAQKQNDYHRRLSDHADSENDPKSNSVLIDLEEEREQEENDNGGKIVVDKNLKLKQENKLLQENFQNLINKIENEKVRSANGQFSNAKTKFLWEKAVNSGSFNEDQLEALKEELKHFDNRLNKLKFVENDLLRQKYKLSKMQKSYDQSDEYKKLHAQLKDHEKKAEKFETYLKRKLEL